MINFFIINNEIFSNLLIISILSFLVRQSLIITGQYWVYGNNQLLTFLILPVITYLVTTVISGNIALSLGMVGALSIVRFRTPIRSSLELTIIFALITIGIAGYVEINVSIILSFIVILCTLIVFILKKSHILSSYNILKLDNSYEESKYYIEIVINERLEEIEENNQLANISFSDHDNLWNYRLVFNDKKSLKLFKNDIINKYSEIKSINVNFH